MRSSSVRWDGQIRTSTNNRIGRTYLSHPLCELEDALDETQVAVGELFPLDKGKIPYEYEDMLTWNGPYEPTEFDLIAVNEDLAEWSAAGLPISAESDHGDFA